MKYYFAARYSRHAEMRKYRDELMMAPTLGLGGNYVTSSWIDAHKGEWQTSMTAAQIQERTVEAADFANTDLADIDECHFFIAFTEAENGDSKGGRHVEFGYALCQGKELIIIGPRENVFYALAHQQYDTWEAFLESLEDWEARRGLHD